MDELIVVVNGLMVLVNRLIVSVDGLIDGLSDR